MAKTLADVMTKTPHSIGLDQDLKTVKELFLEYGIRHLPVRSAGQIKGVVSERDVLLALAVEKKYDHEMTVEDVFSEDPKQFSSDTPLKQVAQALYEEKVSLSPFLVEVSRLFSQTVALRSVQ